MRVAAIEALLAPGGLLTAKTDARGLRSYTQTFLHSLEAVQEMGRVFDGLYQFCRDQLAPVDPKGGRD